VARKENPLHDNPRSKKISDEQRSAKKGDVEEIDGEEWQSVGEKWMGKDDSLHSDVDDGELDARAVKDPKTGKTRLEGKGLDDIRVKDSEGGRRREYFKRKQPSPTS
jgi:hypothetical protein